MTTATTNPYADTAETYWNQGWRGILPVPRGTKEIDVKGFTGNQGKDTSYPDIQTWIDHRGHDNIALRIPHNVVGIDIDNYAGKTGAATLTHAETLWGPLPPTIISTSRDDGASGIRLYRVPPGHTIKASIIGFPEHQLGGIEICRHGHRYAIVEPSIHPEGRPYRWLTPTFTPLGHIPAPHELAELPTTWAVELSKGSGLSAVENVDIAEAMNQVTTGDMSAEVLDDLQDTIHRLHHPEGTSRHEIALSGVGRLLRRSEQGHPGAREAINKLGAEFILAVTPDRPADLAYAEYKRMLINPRIHGLIAATPTPPDLHQLGGFSEPEAAAIVAEQLADRKTTETRKTETDVGSEISPTQENDKTSETDTPPMSAIDRLLDLEGGFWNARPSLTSIYLQALGRMVSPWAVFGVCTVRALATVPYWMTLPPIVGGKGSVNSFVGLVGSSGDGKGAAESAATELLPLPEGIRIAPAGSGEGIAHQYAHMEKRELVRDAQSVIFSIPEVDTLTGIGSRSGSTIMSKLRNAYSGEDLGFAYADPTRRIQLGAHTYRLGMVVGIQPGRARPLIDDADGGTPQRFLWLPATDPRISRDRPDTPPILRVPGAVRWPSSETHFTIPQAAQDTIIDARVARATGDTTALNGHALFTREKVMVALAVLDDRITPNEEDWELSGIVMAISDQTRAQVVATLALETVREAKQRGIEQAITRMTSEDEISDRRSKQLNGWVVRKLSEKGEMTVAGLARLAKADRRGLVPDVVVFLASEGLIEFDESTGMVRPK